MFGETSQHGALAALTGNLGKPLAEAELAYQRLRHLIVSLKLEPGTTVDVVSLSKRLEIGRTPIREALWRLQQDNLVRIMPRKGTLISPIDIAELQEVDEMRWNLESLAARWAAARITPEELENMESLVAKAEAGEFTEIEDWHVEVDRQFHTLLAQASHNRYMGSSLGRLYNHSVRLFYASRARMAQASEEMYDYQAVIAALRHGDPDAAERAIQAHLNDSRRRIASAFGPPARGG